jgi:DUF4097 and DUF4098 domain-containing protein YvlB
MALTVNGENGHTQVRGMGGTINVKQGTGSVTVTDCKRDEGPIEVINGAGDVTLRNVQGPVSVDVTRGDAETQQVFGAQTITTTDGRTLIDAPMGPVTITSRGGSVRVIALDGVHGDYAIDIAKGDLGLVLSPSADAALDVRTQNGEVHSAVPLGGSIDRGVRQFTGTLKEGKHRIALSAEDGDITID